MAATTPPSPSPSPPPSALSVPVVSSQISNLPLIFLGFLFIVTIVLIVKAVFLYVRSRPRPILPSSNSDTPANIPASYPNFNTLGLADAAINAVIETIPLSIYTRESNEQECAVCLLQFEENDDVRTLPVYHHTYHVDCVDKWLRLSATCPLCRAGIRPESR